MRLFKRLFVLVLVMPTVFGGFRTGNALTVAAESKPAKMTREIDASGGCDGIKNGAQAFHTNKENQPWWQVDLGKLYNLSHAVIFNSSICPERSSKLMIMISRDGKKWETVYRHDGQVFGPSISKGSPLSCSLAGRSARFLRIALPGPEYLHLDEVEVYGTEDKKLNLALGKPATQSSISQWSTFPGGKLNKEKVAGKVSPSVSKTEVLYNGEKILPSFGTTAGFWLFAKENSPQMAMMGHPAEQAVAVLNPADSVSLIVPVSNNSNNATGMKLHLTGLYPEGGRLNVRITKIKDGQENLQVEEVMLKKDELRIVTLTGKIPEKLKIILQASGNVATVRLNLYIQMDDNTVVPVSLDPKRRPKDRQPVLSSPQLQPAIEDALIKWDWRMHDGIGTPREPVSYEDAIVETLRRGDLLADDLAKQNNQPQGVIEIWRSMRKKYESLKNESKRSDTGSAWEKLWLETHQAKRNMVLSNPLFTKTGPLLFCKRVPSIMSHQLTQYYGYTSRPGGGLFVLDKPGKSMQVRCLTESLPDGSYLKPEVSYDGQKIFFSFCSAKDAPTYWRDKSRMNRYYHIYSMTSNGSDIKKLTSGNFDHIQPVMLPDGSLMCSSSRRGGFHRCGSGPCYLYTLTALEADGSNIRQISFHETNEWDPVVLNDGRIVYTRWDYVDRDASYYQHLWACRQDGSNVQIYYGNNTWNPMGIWETRSIPGSNKVMGTAGPHHGMSAGSIVLLDRNLGVDGPEPLRRLTPDALFPESEAALGRITKHGAMPEFDVKFSGGDDGGWLRDFSKHRRTEKPIEQRRWPGHCYRSPWPLSENYFLAAYSYDRLRGELNANIPNMFGLYLVDVFGNRELLYRDSNISSQWPIPLKARPVPPQMPSLNKDTGNQPGIISMQNVYESWPEKLGDKVTHLRIIQVLKKTTPNADQPPVGKAFAAPGKQVLGTVPVEEDGSAFFEVPSKTAILFQALDAKGRAIQTMRSLTYLQPGENLSCVGCHESRTAPPMVSNGKAFSRAPSRIKPGPEGSKPFSYPILVQGILDKHCVRCHSSRNPKGPAGKISLTAKPEGHFTQSYNNLVNHIAYTAWGMPNRNYEPMTLPGRFGSRASNLVKLLEKGHHKVNLSAEEWERLITWIDANGLFYGTFDVKEQAKQKIGLKIKGPIE